MADSNTPLWLELKKDYIDDNFENLIGYLADSNKTRDSFYELTLTLLNKRVDAAIQEILQRPVYQECEEVKDRCLFNVRLLAAKLLVDEACRATVEGHAAFVAMVCELGLLVPKFSDKLIASAIKCIEHNAIDNIGIRWNDIKNPLLDIMAYNVGEYATFSSPRHNTLWHLALGAVGIDRKGIVVTTDPEKKLPTAISCDPDIRLLTAVKLHASGSQDDSTLDGFARSVVNALPRTSLLKPQTLKRYAPGDQTEVKVLSVYYSYMEVETIDPNYQCLKGRVETTKKSLVYYYPNIIFSNLQKGDVIPVVIEDIDTCRFSIDDTFIEFLVEDCRDNGLDDSFLALLLDLKPNYLVWITERGTIVYTPNSGNYAKGDFAYVKVSNLNDGDYYGKIDGEVTSEAAEGDSFDEREVRRNFIRDFPYAPNDDSSSAQSQAPETLPDTLPRLFVRLLFNYQHHLIDINQRFQLLSILTVMATIANDNSAADYIDFVTTYLRILVRFSHGENLANLNLEVPKSCEEAQPATLRKSIVTILSYWGKPGHEEALNKVALEFEEKSPVLSRVARIVQTSNNLGELVTGASLNVLKREIIRTLSLQTEEESDLETGSNIYLGVESGSIEFKESIVYPPEYGGQPNETQQQRNVFRGICAFLNSTTGGTLYIGVSDQGYVKGIKRDMDYLKISDIDNYIRLHIQDPAKEKLGLEAIMHLRIETLYDNQVVAIHVEPYPYGIVELEEKAYIRINAESREMNDTVRRQILQKKVSYNKGMAENIASLSQACNNQRCVVAHNYSSSNSHSLADRKLEPYKVLPEHNIVVAFDVDSADCKIFKIARIGYVEILDEVWQHKSQHKDIRIDHFHMSGERPFRVELKLDLMAKNLLVEEYPTAKNDLNGKDDEWYLSTNIYNFSGITRFYVGLAEHIQIINSPEFQEYVNAYKETLIRNL